jgi:response regulator of citrate/malate metabolism
MTRKVLLIDDDQITNFFNRKLIQKSFQSIEVYTVTSVEEAILFLKEKKYTWIPDLILLDVFMPVKNGWDFLTEFQQEFQNEATKVKLYMLSSSVYQDDIEKAKSHEIVKDYIFKPLSFNILNKILD